jgi:hypothetical protein
MQYFPVHELPGELLSKIVRITENSYTEQLTSKDIYDFYQVLKHYDLNLAKQFFADSAIVEFLNHQLNNSLLDEYQERVADQMLEIIEFHQIF